MRRRYLNLDRSDKPLTWQAVLRTRKPSYLQPSDYLGPGDYSIIDAVKNGQPLMKDLVS